MIASRLVLSVAALALLSAAPAVAAPAYVKSNVNLRTAAGTDNSIMAKIPAGSLVDAANCTDWCEVSWQGMRGFAIASVLDRSGRVPVRQAARPPGGPVVAAGEYAAVGPAVVVAPAPYYRPYYWGYRPGWGYRGYGYGYGYRRWRY